MSGKIEEILICENAGEVLLQKENASLVRGKGIDGDRYFHKKGTFSEALKDKGDFEVTLIEIEEINAFNTISGLGYSSSEFRRNLVTSGIKLNELVGKEFTVGNVTLYGVRLCEPCAHLAKLLGQSVMEHMIHKAGLRAIVKGSGSIRVGCDIAQC